MANKSAKSQTSYLRAVYFKRILKTTKQTQSLPTTEEKNAGSFSRPREYMTHGSTWPPPLIPSGHSGLLTTYHTHQASSCHSCIFKMSGTLFAQFASSWPSVRPLSSQFPGPLLGSPCWPSHLRCAHPVLLPSFNLTFLFHSLHSTNSSHLRNS